MCSHVKACQHPPPPLLLPPFIRHYHSRGRGSKCSSSNHIHSVVIVNRILSKQRIMIDYPIWTAFTEPPLLPRTDDDVNSPLLNTNAIAHNLVTMTPCRPCSNIYVDLNMHNSISIPAINANHHESVQAQIRDIAHNTKNVPTLYLTALYRWRLVKTVGLSYRTVNFVSSHHLIPKNGSFKHDCGKSAMLHKKVGRSVVCEEASLYMNSSTEDFFSIRNQKETMTCSANVTVVQLEIIAMLWSQQLYQEFVLPSYSQYPILMLHVGWLTSDKGDAVYLQIIDFYF